MEYPQPNVLLVLSRHAEQASPISPANKERAELAAGIAKLIAPRLVIFSGGCSRHHHEQPTPGSQMLKCALEYSAELSANTHYIAEEGSANTAEALLFSRPLLDPTDYVGVISDQLHFRFGRIHMLAHRILPHNRIHPIEYMRYVTYQEYWEEKIAATLTKLAVINLNPDNRQQIMRRYRHIEPISHRAAKIRVRNIAA